jgi:hypothetical protein
MLSVKRQWKIMRISKTGVFLCFLYLIASIGCVILAQFISDPKGKFIILQMPVVIQHGLLLALDATHLLRNMSWPLVYIVLGVPMLGFLILVGIIFEVGFSKIRSGVSALIKALHRTNR